MRKSAERDNPGDTRPNAPLRLNAPAKINLHLRVGRRRNDGFHPLLTWMSTIGLFDTLTFQLERGQAEPRPLEFSFRLSSSDATLPNDSGNLVIRAATALADTLGRAGEG